MKTHSKNPPENFSSPISDPVQDYYDRKAAARKEELAKLEALIKSGASEAAIRSQKARVDQASYVGD